MEKRAEFKVLDFTVLAKRKGATGGQLKQTRTWERTDRQIEREGERRPVEAGGGRQWWRVQQWKQLPLLPQVT